MKPTYTVIVEYWKGLIRPTRYRHPSIFIIIIHRLLILLLNRKQLWKTASTLDERTVQNITTLANNLCVVHLEILTSNMMPRVRVICLFLSLSVDTILSFQRFNYFSFSFNSPLRAGHLRTITCPTKAKPAFSFLAMKTMEILIANI